jgi:hypothetical protein
MANVEMTPHRRAAQPNFRFKNCRSGFTPRWFENRGVKPLRPKPEQRALKETGALPVCPPGARTHARGMSLRWLFLFLGLSAAAFAAVPGDHQTVVIAPTKTSVYIGSVSMTMPPFQRVQDRYESTYVAKVFPYFFYNEQGKLAIDFSDDQFAQLARGERVNFKGSGRSDDGEDRHVEGTATPTDAESGKIKVRVFVSKKIQLIFNTTYRFGPAQVVPTKP